MMATVSDESAIELRHNRYTMGCLLPWNIADYLAVLSIYDHGVRSARDKQAMALSVNGHVVPSSFSTDVKSFSHAPS
jgi:hypothetical protein